MAGKTPRWDGWGVLATLAGAVFLGLAAGGRNRRGRPRPGGPGPARPGGRGPRVRVNWDGHAIEGIDRISGLERTTEVVAHREGGDPSLQRLSPGKTAYEPILLVRPRGEDRAFEQWADQVWQLGAPLGAEVSLRDFRKDLTIEYLDAAGRPVLVYRVYRCWPSHYVALGGLHYRPERGAIESLTLQHEGWERDLSV
jgi:phage tail-like protein